MKRILGLVLLMTTSWGPAVRAQSIVRVSAPQVKDEVLAGTEKFANGAKNSTEVNLDPGMIGMISGGSGDLSDLARKMDFVVVRTYEYDKPGMYRTEDVEDVRNRLNGHNWNCFIRVRESKHSESTDICSRSSENNQTNELIIIAAEEKELTFVHLKGRMTLADLQKMNMVPGMRGLGTAMPPGPRIMMTAPPPPPPPRRPSQPRTPATPNTPAAPGAPAAPSAP